MKRGFIGLVVRMGIGVPSTRFFLVVISTLVLISTAVAFAEDWPEFRGPTGQGISSEEDLPTHWGPDENVVWKVPVVGQGWSSPVYVQGQVYLTGATGGGDDGDYSLNAMCYRADTGKQLWSTMVFHQSSKDDAGIHSKNGHASPTPLISQGRMYVHFGHQGTACLDLEGNVLWKNNELTYNPVHGNGGSPVLAAGVLIFSCDGGDKPFIAALDAESGKLRWKVDREVDAPKKFSFSTPLVIEVAGRQQVVSPGTNSVSAFDPIDGSEIWRVRYDGYSVVPRPVMGHGLLYMSTGFDEAELLAIRVDGHGDVTDTHIAWRVKKGVPNTPSMLLIGDELYMVSDRGVASCLDASGGKTHWQHRIGGAYSSSLLFANGNIYLQSEDGPATVIKAGKEFEEVAKNDLEERTLASYAVGDGAFFIRTADHLYRIGGK